MIFDRQQYSYEFAKREFRVRALRQLSDVPLCRDVAVLRHGRVNPANLTWAVYTIIESAARISLLLHFITS